MRCRRVSSSSSSSSSSIRGGARTIRKLPGLNIFRLVPTVRMNAQPSQRILATTWACAHAQSNAQSHVSTGQGLSPGAVGRQNVHNWRHGALRPTRLAPPRPRTPAARAAAARPRACARCAAGPAGRASSTAAPAASWGRATKRSPSLLAN